MNCDVCGTELPRGAMFCGECGRAVGGRLTAVHPDSGMPVQAPAPAPARPGDTRIIEPVDLDLLEPVRAEEQASAPAGDDIEQDLPPDVVAEEDAVLTPVAVARDFSPAGAPAGVAHAVGEAAPAEEPVSVSVNERPAAAPRPPDLERVSVPAPHLPTSPAQDAPLASTPPPMRRPDPFPWGERGAAVFSDSDELEQTLIVPRRDSGERFVLQFSTGESVTVFGTGLLGRNPQPQPGEYFDQLVAITDPGKSVSKTHLEFGQDSGAFWVSDRYSGNGSVVREPEMPARRLEAGKRYRIVRGSRVDIGEQFFVVS